MDPDYWIHIIDRLKDPAGADSAAHVLASGLGVGLELENTNLGEVLQHVPREEIIYSTLQALRNPSAQPYCEQILWYFEPEEIIMIYKQLRDPDEQIRKGLQRYLQDVESPLLVEL